MTPAARIGAAIEILDRVVSGGAAEQLLTGWARANRFAGSGDRNAIRDHVFDALRCLRSFTALAGASEPSGRALMIGALRSAGTDPATIFTGEGYAPTPLSAAERAALDAAPGFADLPELVALDCPDWLAPALRQSLGAEFAPVMARQRQRAPVFLRVNAARTTRHEAQTALARENIGTVTHQLAKCALEVTENERKIKQSAAYREGLVELQDVSPQAAVEALPLRPGMRVLDYCAGGGGKVLAMAARMAGAYAAHDVAPQRLRDLPERARRAGVSVEIVTPNALRNRKFDLILLDVPCSGSGTWRRSPDAKWMFTAERLNELCRVQDQILSSAPDLVAEGGVIAYMTCSMLEAENYGRIARFTEKHPDWQLAQSRFYSPLDGGDGFFSALLTRL